MILEHTLCSCNLQGTQVSEPYRPFYRGAYICKTSSLSLIHYIHLVNSVLPNDVLSVLFQGSENSLHEAIITCIYLEQLHAS